MENTQERPKARPISGIHYLRARPENHTGEVRFVPARYREAKEPEELAVGNRNKTTFSSEPPSQPKRKRHWMPSKETLAAILALGWFAILIPLSKATQSLRELDLLRPPPPELVPAHPTVGMIITDHHHIWIYLPTGWIDP